MTPRRASPGFKLWFICLWRIQLEDVPCIFCLSLLPPASPAPEAGLPSLLLSGALIPHLAISQEEADAGGWRLRRVRQGLCPALLWSQWALHNPDVIIFSPAQPFRVEPTPYRASHIPFGQKNHVLPGRSVDIWSSTHRASIPFSSLQHHPEVEKSPHPVPQVGSIHNKPRLGPTPRRDAAQLSRVFSGQPCSALRTILNG